MKQSGKISDSYLGLFLHREGKVVLGKGYSTLWILSLVLFATFLAIAFSNASMKYLSDKMEDPFIRWMDIENNGDGDFPGLESALGESANATAFDYSGVESGYRESEFFYGNEGRIQYYRIRYFEDMHSDLMAAILDEDNIVEDWVIDMIPETTIGVVVTKEAIHNLGYEKAPAYISWGGLSEGADSLGYKMVGGGFVPVPLPVLAVVKRLPSNVDLIASSYLLEQYYNENHYPFNLSANRLYSEDLHFFVPADADGSLFAEDLRSVCDSLSSRPVDLDDISFYKPEITPFVKGDYLSVFGKGGPLAPREANAISDCILEKWGEKGVFRVFDYNFSPYSVSQKSYLSVNLNSLDHVREFESYVRNNFKIKLDMSQVNAKENFNAVSIMAEILSWAIIVFAITCIILFIVNLLQSYFQKVKRNLGTFKAFGVSNSRLIKVYVLIIGGTILAAVCISLAATFCLQEALILCKVLKDGIYSYLSLWSTKTFLSILIILFSSVGTVFIVMNGLLRHTPGDLIYDRQ